MSVSEAMLQEFIVEAANTRRLLERVPDEHFGWRPHPKSFTLGKLASHVAEIPWWSGPTIDDDELVFDPAKHKAPEYDNCAALLQGFDAAVESGRAAFGRLQDSALGRIWHFKMADGQVVFELPKAAVLRSMVLNHSVHHRGQLTVYLRLKDVPLPSIYGPSADESK